MHASAVLSQPDRRTVKKAEQIFSKLMKPNCLFNRHIREERSVSMERIGGAIISAACCASLRRIFRWNARLPDSRIYPDEAKERFYAWKTGFENVI